MVETKTEAPFVEFKKTNFDSTLSKDIKNIEEYISAALKAKDKIEPFIERAKEFSEKAPDLPEKAKDEVENSDLGYMDKVKAVSATSSNCKQLSKLPGFVDQFKYLVQSCITEIKDTGKELNDNKGNVKKIHDDCSKLRNKNPRYCYETCGQKINVTPELKKDWEYRMKLLKGRSASKPKSKH